MAEQRKRSLENSFDGDGLVLDVDADDLDMLDGLDEDLEDDNNKKKKDPPKLQAETPIGNDRPWTKNSNQRPAKSQRLQTTKMSDRLGRSSAPIMNSSDLGRSSAPIPKLRIPKLSGATCQSHIANNNRSPNPTKESISARLNKRSAPPILPTTASSSASPKTFQSTKKTRGRTRDPRQNKPRQLEPPDRERLAMAKAAVIKEKHITRRSLHVDYDNPEQYEFDKTYEPTMDKYESLKATGYTPVTGQPEYPDIPYGTPPRSISPRQTFSGFEAATPQRQMPSTPPRPSPAPSPSLSVSTSRAFSPAPSSVGNTSFLDVTIMGEEECSDSASAMNGANGANTTFVDLNTTFADRLLRSK